MNPSERKAIEKADRAADRRGRVGRCPYCGNLAGDRVAHLTAVHKGIKLSAKTLVEGWTIVRAPMRPDRAPVHRRADNPPPDYPPLFDERGDPA